MGRTLLIALCALTLGACGDPLVIIGDLPGFMRVVSGVPNSMGTRDDSSALATTLTHPAGLAASSTGVLYFADQSSRIFSVTSAGKATVLTKSFFCFDKSCLGRPQGIVLSKDERLIYIVDDMSDKIWRLTIANGDLVAIAGNGVDGASPDGTVATAANLSSPHSIVVLADGRIAFTERNNSRIRFIGADGKLGTLVGNLNVPTGLTYDGSNTLYVSEAITSVVKRVDLNSGTATVVAGSGAQGYSGDGGPATSALLNTPTFLAVNDSTLYIADQQNDRIRSVNLSTGIIETFAGTGSKVYSGNGRAAAETSLNYPNGLAVSPFGYLYISDYGHNIVWRTPVKATLQQ